VKLPALGIDAFSLREYLLTSGPLIDLDKALKGRPSFLDHLRVKGYVAETD
jgi:hypothetical protein